MKLRMRYLIFIFMLIILCNNKVLALNCTYNNIKITINEETNKITTDHKLDDYKWDLSGGFKWYYSFDFTYLERYLNEHDINGKCFESIYIVDDYSRNESSESHDYYFFTDELQYQEISKEVEDNCSWCYSSEATSADYYCEKKFGSNCTTGPCETYDNMLENIVNDYKDSNSCDSSNCKIDKITSAKSNTDKLKNLCNNLVSSANYNSNCLRRCLNLETDLKNLGINKDLDRVCGFSERLLSWIANILRWVKYIVPVIVIVMGIIDFIKAIAGDKADEMKKAQSKFTKRLIAAALVFIIPLILEFVLDKMGFGYDDCGLF